MEPYICIHAHFYQPPREKTGQSWVEIFLFLGKKIGVQGEQ
jgi:hypothetical protein